MDTSEKPPFYLGLCMAGAISAGAYTAGVIDYLIEALDRWEKARQTNDPRIPTHRVIIDLMTGASAGGMTAAISLAALFDRMDPVDEEHGGYEHFTGYNKLYQAWVKLTADEMLPELLKTTDIPEHGAASLLNSDFIDTIAEKMLRVKHATMRQYVSPDVEICLSLSSLTGIPAIIKFGNDEPEPNHLREHAVDGRFITYNHRDYGHFILNSQYQNDGRIPVSFQTPDDEGLQILRDCAMATGAFPIGLRWRAVRRKGKYLNQSKLINPNVNRPLFGIKDEEEFATVNVDGGVLDNEPFDIAQRLFKEYRNRPIKQGQDTGASILMIDPFPSIEDESQIKPKSKIRLKTIIGEIYSTMRTQLLFMPDDLEDATNPGIYSRFLMAPTRNFPSRGKVIGSKAIACGSLEGFGGFLTKDFRTHDFQLGRRNCQQFLRRHFTLPIDTTNPIVSAGYLKSEALAAFKTEIRTKDPAGNEVRKYVLPIIPDIDLNRKSARAKDEEKPRWPVYNEVTMRDLISKNEEAIQARFLAVLADNKFLDGFGIRALAYLFKRGASRAIYDVMIEDLKAHHLIHETD